MARYDYWEKKNLPPAISKVLHSFAGLLSLPLLSTTWTIDRRTAAP